MTPLDKEEFTLMVSLLRRYANYNMDQFENWKFDSNKGSVFISLSLKADDFEFAYDDLSNIGLDSK